MINWASVGYMTGLAMASLGIAILARATLVGH
jgi:hypothetical protein